MTGILSTEASKWAETVESNGEKCLISPVSAKNVEHVLSTATIRGPQKNLFVAVTPFVTKMLADANGVSILTSLVKYGVAKTVESLAKLLMGADKDLWTLKTEPAKELAVPLGELFDALIYREDCRDDTINEMVSAISSAKAAKILSNSFTLPASGRFFALDTKFAARLAKDEEGKKALHAAGASATEKNAAAGFCDRALSSNENEAASKYLFDVFFVPAPDATMRPREEIVLLIVSKATPAVVTKVAKVMLKWSNLRDLVKRDAYANVFAEVVLRADDVETAKKLVVSVLDSVAVVDTMLASRKKPQLRLLAAIDDKPAILAALEKKVGAPLHGKLRGSKVQYTNATVPRATATQQAIMAKLQLLSKSKDNSKAPKAKAQKRSRE